MNNAKQPRFASARRAVRWLVYAAIAATLLPGWAAAQVPDLKITDYQLVSSKRINATQFQYEYRVVATNSGAAAQQVTASVMPSTAATQIVEGGASFGTVLTGQAVSSLTTIKLIQDRRYPLSVNDLHWSFEYVAPPARLDGAPTDLAANAARDFDAGDVTPDSEVSAHPNYGRIARTSLVIIFNDAATTAQVNDVLDFLHGGITSMLSNFATFVVRIPDPGSIAALDSLIASVDAMPGVSRAFPELIANPGLLPGNPGLGSDPNALSRLDLIAHQLAAKAHGLWNAKSLVDGVILDAPTFLIWDYFGNGAPHGPLWSFATPVPRDFASSVPMVHGYEVASVFGASFGGPTDDTNDQLTGLYPGFLALRAYAIKKQDVNEGWPRLFFRALRQITVSSPGQSFVVNVSIDGCEAAENPPCMSEAWSAAMESVGAQLVRKIKDPLLGLDKRVLFVANAGNIVWPYYSKGGRGPLQRAIIGPFSAAAGVEPLRNGLAVGNIQHNPATAPTNAVGCLSNSSEVGSNIAGFGMHIPLLQDPTGIVGFATGTSFAAPQVAAVAEFLWSVKTYPALSASDIADRIIASGRKTSASCFLGDDPTVLDAYAAALTVDSAIQIGHAPVRMAILDVANDQDQDIPDGKFDEHDVRRYLKAFSESAKVAAASGGYVADYSRFDINGDGYTGGDATNTHFKLQEPFPATYTRPHLLEYGTVTQDIEGVPVSFDEKNLTDLEILAYYAYSPLFSSTPDGDLERTLLFLPYADHLHLKVDSIEINWSPALLASPPAGWIFSPTIYLSDLSTPSPFFFGNNGKFERGTTPLFSETVLAAGPASFYGINTTSGIPYVSSQPAPNRNNASSFLALGESPGKVWINATGIGVNSWLEREYQSRFYLGDPGVTRHATKSVTVGSVPGDGVFRPYVPLAGDVFSVAFKFIGAP